MNKQCFLVLVYPDGHGSVELVDEDYNVLGLSSLFANKQTMLEVVGDVCGSYRVVEIRFENR